MNNVIKNKKIVLFGVGQGDKSVSDYLLHKFKKNNIKVKYFLDNYYNENSYNNIPVYKVERIARERIDDIFIIITSIGSAQKMSEQLNEYGLVKNVNYACVDECESIFNKIDYDIYKDSIIKDELYYPSVLYLDLSGCCNLKCLQCIYHSEYLPRSEKANSINMNIETINSIIKQINEVGTIKKIILTGNGEFLINKNWDIFLNKIHDETGIEDISITSNGMLMDSKQVEKLQKLKYKKLHVNISIDGTTPSECEELRRGSSYSILKENIMNISKCIDSVILRNAYIVNRGDIVENKTQYKMNIKVPQYLREDFKNIPIVSYPIVSYSKVADKFRENNYDIVDIIDDNVITCTHCFKMVSIDSYGNITKCGCGEAAMEYLGNINKDSLIEVWNNNAINDARDLIKKGIAPDFCKECPTNIEGKYKIFIKNK